jgi:chitodextrinase
MKASNIIRGAAIALALTGLVAGTAQAGDEAAQFKQTIEKAEASKKKAASVNGEWRDTGKLIKKAQAAAKKGDYANAINLANTAYRQGELGYQQAVEQKDAGFPSYMR